MCDLKNESIISTEDDRTITNEIIKLLPPIKKWEATNLDELCSLFKEFQKKIDYEVQNFLFREDKSLHFDFLINSPSLTYGIPEILHCNVEFFKNKYVLYLIDELENFSEKQQELIQILIREKPTSCSVRIGTRPYGIRTHYILNAIEENRIGSEFELIILDEFLRDSDNYKDYLKEICNKRLESLGIPELVNITDVLENVSAEDVLNRISGKTEPQSRGCFSNLKKNLKKISLEKDDISKIIEALCFPKDLIIERTNVLLFYRRWSGTKRKTSIKKRSSSMARFPNQGARKI